MNILYTTILLRPIIKYNNTCINSILLKKVIEFNKSILSSLDLVKSIPDLKMTIVSSK